MDTMASQITSLTIVYSTIYSVVEQRKHQSPASLAFVRAIHRWPLSPPHKGPVTRKIFSLDGVIMFRGRKNASELLSIYQLKLIEAELRIYICVGKTTIIGSDNVLSPGRCQAIIWTNDGILLIGTLGTNSVKF